MKEFHRKSMVGRNFPYFWRYGGFVFRKQVPAGESDGNGFIPARGNGRPEAVKKKEPDDRLMTAPAVA